MKNSGTLTGQSSGINLATVNGVSETTENVSASIIPSNLKSAGQQTITVFYSGDGNFLYQHLRP